MTKPLAIISMFSALLLPIIGMLRSDDPLFWIAAAVMGLVCAVVGVVCMQIHATWYQDAAAAKLRSICDNVMERHGSTIVGFVGDREVTLRDVVSQITGD